jgi:hypothetical protein
MTDTTLSPCPSDDEDDNASTTSGESYETDASSFCSTPPSPNSDVTLYSGTYSEPRVGFNDFESYIKHSHDIDAPECTGPPGKTLSSVKTSPSATEAAQDLTLSLPSTTETFRWAAGISYLIPDGAHPIEKFSTQMAVCTNQPDQDADQTLPKTDESRVAQELAVTGDRELHDFHRQIVSAIHYTHMTREEGYGFIQDLLPRIQGEGTVLEHQQGFQVVKSELASFIGAAWKKTLDAEPSTVYRKYMPGSGIKEEPIGISLEASHKPESSGPIGPACDGQKRSSKGSSVWLSPGLYNSSNLGPRADRRPDSEPNGIIWSPDTVSSLYSCHSSLSPDPLLEGGPEEKEYEWTASATLHLDHLLTKFLKKSCPKSAPKLWMEFR